MPFDGTDFREVEFDPDLAALRRARACIVMPGRWHQGSLEYDGSRCAIGWLNAVGDYQTADTLFDAAHRLLGPALPWHWRIIFGATRAGAVIAFNDVKWRRQRRMVKLFDRAITLRERKLGRLTTSTARPG